MEPKQNLLDNSVINNHLFSFQFSLTFYSCCSTSAIGVVLSDEEGGIGKNVGDNQKHLKGK